MYGSSVCQKAVRRLSKTGLLYRKLAFPGVSLRGVSREVILPFFQTLT